MFLVLAAATDLVAAAVTARLPTGSVEWFTPSDLHRAKWQHRIDDAGTHFSVTLNARVVRDGDVRAVLNRLQWLPPTHFRHQRDREYAAFEWHALLLSVLHRMRERVMNPASPPSLAGPRWSPLQTLSALRAAGIPVRRVTATVDARTHTRPGWDRQPWDMWLEPLAHEGSADLNGHVPPGRRPAVWVEPVRDVRTCWVVGDAHLGPHRSGDPNLGVVSAVLGCPFLGVDIAATEDGTVIAAVRPFPADIPAAVSAAVASWLREQS